MSRIITGGLAAMAAFALIISFGLAVSGEDVPAADGFWADICLAFIAYGVCKMAHYAEKNSK